MYEARDRTFVPCGIERYLSAARREVNAEPLASAPRKESMSALVVQLSPIHGDRQARGVQVPVVKTLAREREASQAEEAQWINGS
jgi:hypothetical protein